MDQLTPDQLNEWEAYSKIDPIGEWVDEFRFARLQALVLNIVQRLYAKKGSTPKDIDPIDFMPDWLGERKPKTQSWQEMKETLMRLAEDQNKKVDSKTKAITRKPVKR